MERKRAANHSVLNRHLVLFQVLFTDILLVLIILHFTDEETKTQRSDRPAAEVELEKKSLGFYYLPKTSFRPK